MLYYPDFLLEQLLLDDINQGDLTTRLLGIGGRAGVMAFCLKKFGRASGIRPVCKILKKLDLEILHAATDGSDLEAEAVLVKAAGKAEALHMGWKVCQNILEWSCGVADYMARMLAQARKFNPAIQIVCTRKNIPGTKLIAMDAVLNGGGQIHRCGTAETILLFANHRVFFADVADFGRQIAVLRQNAPEKKIIVEADSMEDVNLILQALPDIIQLDKFTPDEIRQALQLVEQSGLSVEISAAGGINLDNAAEYAQTGVNMLVTSSAYYAKPADVKVTMTAGKTAQSLLK